MVQLFRKGQGLPLNTIVIAILVIIVLLVIVVFFTSRVGETGGQLDENSAVDCSINNPAISALGRYDDANFQDTCDGEAFDTLVFIPKNDNGQVCCARVEDRAAL